MAKNNRDVYREMQEVGVDHNARVRDVYNTQQVTRSDLKPVATKKSKLKLAVITMTASIIALYFIGNWFMASIFSISHTSQISKYKHLLTALDNDNAKQDGYFIDYEGNVITYVDDREGVFYEYIEDGKVDDSQSYTSIAEVPVPDWYNDMYTQKMKERQDYIDKGYTPDVVKKSVKKYLGQADYKYRLLHPELVFLFVLFVGYIAGTFALYGFLVLQLKRENLLSDTGELNQYTNDQHIQTPLELLENPAFDLVPDAGAHHKHRVSGIVAHVMLNNDGVKTVDGVPFFDKEFGERLFDSADVIPERRKWFSPKKVKYNPKNRSRDRRNPGKDKNGNPLKPYDTLADLINAEWYVPDYEPQLPGGAYIVDTRPINTLVVAMTRAGKGQTYIEADIDCKSRQDTKNNIICNDPKGELVIKFYDRLTARGYLIQQFNLQVPMKTNIYNPLGLIADMVRMGDSSGASEAMVALAEVFFPTEGAQDPMWPNAAANATKRSAYGLIDYYTEEEEELKELAFKEKWSAKKLDREINQLWSKVSMYNAYKYFVELSSRKVKNPANKLKELVEARKEGQGEWADLSKEEVDARIKQITIQSEKLFNSAPEIDMLTAYARATALLPKNDIRTLMTDAHASLDAMSGSEKTISSVYGIAITALSYFSDPVIIRLTSGPPSENFDVAAVAFPRMFGFMLNKEYMRAKKLLGLGVKFTGYADKDFSIPLGSAYDHDDTVTETGWCNCFFSGVFEEDVVYYKAQIFNRRTGYAVKSFYFRLTKKYMATLSGTSYFLDPVLNERIPKGLIVEEIHRDKDGNVFEANSTFVFDTVVWDSIEKKCVKSIVKLPAIERTRATYIEKPLAIFLITPPDKTKYAKLLLIFMSQITNAAFKYTYITKANQKPIVGLDFIIDEAGNLKSEGQGINNLTTLLSIALAQEIQYTLIFQTMQQVKDVYGDTSDQTIQGNTNNMIYIKSTSNELIEYFVKMSGIVHRLRKESRSVQENVNNPILKNAASVSTTISVKEETALSYNDFATIPKANMIVLSAGEPVIWCRNEMAMPYSYALHEHVPTYTDTPYKMQTLPTLSNAMYFDANTAMPNFFDMYEKRIAQAVLAVEVMEEVQKAGNYSDYDILKKDRNLYAKDIMRIVNQRLQDAKNTGSDPLGTKPEYEYDPEIDKAKFDAKKRAMANRNPEMFGGIIEEGALIDESGKPRFDNVYYNDVFKAFTSEYIDKLCELKRKVDGTTIKYFNRGSDGITLLAGKGSTFGNHVIAEGDVLMTRTIDSDVTLHEKFWYYIFSIEGLNDALTGDLLTGLKSVANRFKQSTNED